MAENIREQGVIQPLLVCAIAAGKYEIIAGERRFRAAALAGLSEVPVLVVLLVDNKGAAAMALIENMQREDLSPPQESRGLARLIEEFGFTHKQVGKSVGKSRSAVSNLLRLRQLTKPVQAMPLAGDIDMGHARAGGQMGEKQSKKGASPAVADPGLQRISHEIAELIGLSAEFKLKGRGGLLRTRFSRADELDALFKKLEIDA